MRWWVLALFACASCDRLLGLDQVAPPPPDGSDPSKDTGRVSGTYVQRWNEIAKDTVMAVPQARNYPASQLSGSVTLADGSTRELVITDGAFSFTTPAQGDAYSLHLLGQTGERTWNMTAAAPQLVERLTYPPDRQLAPAGTNLILDISQRHPEGANTQEELITLGTWTRHKIMKPSDPVGIDCSATDMYGVQLGLLVPHDTAYYTSTSLDGTGTYYRIAYSAKVADVTTQPGVTTMLPSVTLPAQPLTLDQCANILAHGAEETTREEALIPSAVTFSEHAWYVDADPSLEFSLISELPLAYYDSTGASVKAMYANPYGLASLDVLLAANTINDQGATLKSQVAVAAAPSCTTQVEIQAGQIELPTNIALGGAAIVTSSQLVPVPHTGKLAVTWDPSPDGRADFYFVLVEQLLDADHLVSVEQIVTADRSVTIPADDFVAANMYQIEVVSSIGYPNAPLGDFATSGATMGMASYTTPPFRVTSQ